MDLQKLLNPEQFEAATAPDGPLLVLAAAGTGKTRTLVYRVVHLLSRGVPPDGILLLTFTNRAAREMLQRAGEAAAGRTEGMWGGTFHHVANRMLRTWAPSIGYPRDFAILDSEDQRSLMGRAIKELGFKPKEFAKKELVLSLLSGAVNRGVPPEEWLEHKAGSFDTVPEDLLRCMREYTKRKRDLGAMDFDDLLVNALRLMRENDRAREIFQERFRHVLVDEYQDVNRLQNEFVDIVSAKHRNLTAVGDDFQCIYSWRGSDYRNIMEFPVRHPGTRIVKLERNYRSRAPILDLANASISHNPDQFAKTLRPTRDAAAAAKPRLDVTADGHDQGLEVVRRIEDLRREGFGLGDIAILYRSHFNAVETQLALARAGVPYRITSGTGFYEQAHVKDVVSLVRMAETPADGLAFSRVMQLLPAVGPATAERIFEKIGGSFDVSSEESRRTLLGALPAKARTAWAQVDAALADWKSRPFPKNVEFAVETFLDAAYREQLRRQYENADEREEDVRQLLSDIASRDSAADFLRDVALLTNLDREIAASAGNGPAVLLSTVHQAKGLEWPVVLLLWTVEGIFPSSRSLDEEGRDDEERRLFYVAVTRAKDRLYMFQPTMRRTQDGSSFPCERSRFLREVPAELYEEGESGEMGERHARAQSGRLGWGGGGWSRDGGWGRSLPGLHDWSF
ncbi:MAG: ATP-dependent helicase [Kiritimatiellae bacterium]|nr:ATP-dependent helicase [Kiritimatiellia bacterium]